jgi:hypothetical protein
LRFFCLNFTGNNPHVEKSSSRPAVKLGPQLQHNHSDLASAGGNGVTKKGKVVFSSYIYK